MLNYELVIDIIGEDNQCFVYTGAVCSVYYSLPHAICISKSLYLSIDIKNSLNTSNTVGVNVIKHLLRS